MAFFHQLIFASDAEIMALWGLGFVLLAALASVMERLRSRRTRLDRVGWVPWTTLLLLSATIGAGLLAVALPTLLRG